jgi:hypothetical protein
MRASTRVAFVFFMAVFGIGLWIYPDFGVSWDEPTQIQLGIQNYRYIVKGDASLLSNLDRFYGPFFEILLVRLQGQGEPRQIYLNRHLINFLCFFLGCITFYGFARRIFRNPWIALIGSVFLVLSPRIFADAFYNSKDIPFLVFYTLALLSMLWFIDHPTPLRALGHAAVMAAAITTRLPGVAVLVLTWAGLAMEVFSGRASLRRAGMNALINLAATLGLGLLFWPVLWSNPLDGLANAFRIMSHFPHASQMLYLGENISSLSPPWHYIPVWMGITTPLVYLIFFGVGLGVLLRMLIRPGSAWFSIQRRNALLILAAFFGPLAAVIVLRSALYDAWRQMFFIYPAFLWIGLFGVEWGGALLTRHLPQRAATLLSVGMLAVGVLPVVGWMMAHHPYENVYFNRLAGADEKSIRQNFMMDYWGLSYRKGLEYILQVDADAVIPVFAETDAGERNIAILPLQEGLRIHIVHDLSQAKYFIGNYYRQPEAYPFKDEIYTVWDGNARLLSVFRLIPEKGSH